MAKDARLAVRLSDAQHELIRAAAALEGQNVSEFAVRTLTHEAQHVLADRSQFRLDEAAWTEFQSLLDRPVQHKPRLETLLSARSVFDES